MGVALLKKGSIDEAEQCQRKALLLRENYSEAWEGLGAIYLYKDDSNMAIDSYRQALVCSPESIAALCGLARSFNMICLYEQANEKIKQALHIAPHNNEARLVQSQIFISLGRLDEALENCNHILKRSPEEKMALSLLASIYEKKNQPEKAYNYLKPLLSDPNPGIETIVCFASVSKSINRVDEAIKMMEDALQSSSYLQSDHRRHLYFALGKAHDSLHNYKMAFKNYESGNQLKQTCFNRFSFKHAIDATIKVFDKDFLTKHSLKSSSTRPVFIIGMPRSGTSLVEQIISSHPQVFGAGERNSINDITKGATKALGSEKTYPECLTEAGEDDLSLFAKSYIDYLDGLDPDVSRVTDKMPSNYLHIGLIHTLFPKAHIIHCMRNPLDTCLSCYFQDFGTNHPWIYDLKDIASVYKEYLRMMRYWQNELNIPMYNVKYEELVENQEKISRELISYIGLEWDEQCLQFHKNQRFIWTASYDQVRQPMYKKSTARWKNYEQQLSPLINILGINNT